MPIPQSAIGAALPPLDVTVERGRLKFFAKATGQADPLYTDVTAAQGAGYPDLPVPPTFFFSLELEAADPFAWLTDLGVKLSSILHGTQKFTYHEMAFAGENLHLTSRITENYEKRGGALEFIVATTEVTRGDTVVATLEKTIVVQHPELAVSK